MATVARPQRAIQPLLQGARGYRKHLGQYGAGGRSSVNDKTVAVFGATGFLGRFVTNQLGERSEGIHACLQAEKWKGTSCKSIAFGLRSGTKNEVLFCKTGGFLPIFVGKNVIR